MLAVGSLRHVRIHRQHAGRVPVIDWNNVDRAVRAGIPWRTLNLAPQGAADLVGVVRTPCPSCGNPVGRSLQLEVKSATGSQTSEQRNYQRVYTEMGAAYILARSEAEALAQLPPPCPPTKKPPSP